ncbi:MAG: beta-L-arabinofuranosidase domain-containing protein, partial [Planctomycetota bacterium]
MRNFTTPAVARGTRALVPVPALFSVCLCLSPGVASAQEREGPAGLEPVPFDAVRLEDAFWGRRLEINRSSTVEANLARCAETGRLENFAVAAGLQAGEHRGLLYNDSDVYKVLEGIALTMAVDPDPLLEERADRIIEWIAAAQEEDGYLNTYVQLVKPGERWADLAHGHELYCCGHLLEAGVAYHRATGKRLLLDVALRFADLLLATFGEDLRLAAPGHQEIELGLLALADHVDQPRYRDLAEFFLRARGDPRRAPLYGAYAQDERSVLEQTTVTGHAVRATYQYSAMADLARHTQDPAWLNVLRALWADVTQRKMYVTGGIGNSAHNEGFTLPYDLPNDSAYCETCASVGMIRWAQRMFLATGESAFVDVLELQLYNNLLAGVSLAGDRFFYVNPLSSSGNHERVPWFDCSCCPTNVVRSLPAVSGAIYAQRADELWVSLYVGSRTQVELTSGTVGVVLTTNYPWEGRVEFQLDTTRAEAFTLELRRPAWCGEDPRVTLNGALQTDVFTRSATDARAGTGWGSLRIPGGGTQRVVLDLPLTPRRIRADPRVEADRGRVALARGPLVYCLEGIDHRGRVDDLALPPEASLAARWDADLLGGTTVLVARGLATVTPDAAGFAAEFGTGLRTGIGTGEETRATESRPLRAVPYALWANRGATEMVVWIPEDPALAASAGAGPVVRAGALQLRASHCWRGDTLQSVVDGQLPSASDDHSLPRLTFWDHRGTLEWLEVVFPEPRQLSASAVYWFDDTGIGACRVPASWRLSYRDRGRWRPVRLTAAVGGSTYGVR